MRVISISNRMNFTDNKVPDIPVNKAVVSTYSEYDSYIEQMFNSRHLTNEGVFARLGHDVIIGGYNFLVLSSMALGSARIGSGNLFGATSTVLDRARVGDNNKIAPVSGYTRVAGATKEWPETLR